MVLLRAFRSLLLPLMAVLLDALSVGASYGLLVVVFRFGLGADVLGLYRVSQIEGWVPVFLFAMLFGLSMDYEVFFVTRMREAWDRGADNGRAVVEGLSRTGRVVSVAAVIMVGALCGLVGGRVAGPAGAGGRVGTGRPARCHGRAGPAHAEPDVAGGALELVAPSPASPALSASKPRPWRNAGGEACRRVLRIVFS